MHASTYTSIAKQFRSTFKPVRLPLTRTCFTKTRVCVYQPIVGGRTPAEAMGDVNSLQIGDWRIRRGSDGELSLKDSARSG